MFKLPKFEVNLKVLFNRHLGMFVAELGGCAAILAGIAHYSHAAAWIVGGVGAVLAIERNR